MSKKTTLLFGIHMHQPIDNFEWVIKKGVELCYGPFFELLSKYPEFHFSVHCSGWLMEQIEQFHPKLYNNIMTLAKKGSIEFFSAGYYEPILSALPSQDRVAQIKTLNNSIQSQFQQTPKGLWLTERVWESSLIPDLHKADIQYTLVDDYHFQCAGFDTDTLDGYFTSEESAHKIGIFPISKKLRYAIPFLSVESAIKTIKSFNRQEDSAAIIFDDAEKFGMWPGTHEWVYEKGWLEKFVQSVIKDESIETMHFAEYYSKNSTRGIAYLPNVSYYEMGEWSLRADDALKLELLKQEMDEERYEKEGVKFLKGGIWKNFFVKYPESNRIHKRTLELSGVAQELDNPKFKTALYKAQTNDALWHGVFGGLYLPSLRDNVYRYIIEAENIRYTKGITIQSDQNELDGYDKIKVVTPKYIFRFDGAYGGQLVEFDTRKECFNWQNTLTRRKEAYHQHILNQKEYSEEKTPSEDGIDTIHVSHAEVDEDLKNSIIYDWHLKNSFIDHISDETFCAESFLHADFKEFSDFANQPFKVRYSKNKIKFSRKGGVYLPHKVDAKLKKQYTPKNKGFNFEIELFVDMQREFSYVLEHNFHFADYDLVFVNGQKLLDMGSIKQTSKLEIIDQYLGKKIVIDLDTICDIEYFALKTISQSEEGYDMSIQCVSFAMVLPFRKSLLVQGKLEVKDV